MAEQEPATGGSIDTSAEIEQAAGATTPASAPPPTAPAEGVGTTAQPARRPRSRRRGMGTARVILALVFLLGLFFSMVPVGRASLAATVLLPAFLSVSEPPPLQVAGEPIRHTSQTISSNSG